MEASRTREAIRDNIVKTSIKSRARNSPNNNSKPNNSNSKPASSNEGNIKEFFLLIKQELIDR